MSHFKDTSDVHAGMGPDGLREAMKHHRRRAQAQPDAQDAAKELPAIVSMGDLINQKMPEPPQIIKGILHEGSKMVLGGGSKSYKTWSLLDLAMSVGSGQPWWGFETAKADVLYINLEISPWAFKKRIEDIQVARMELAVGCSMDVWNLRGYSASFEVLRPKITAGMKKKYGLIVIDPIYKVYGGRDENSAGDMGTLLNEIEALAVETGAAVVFGAHFSKGNQSGKESMDRISGSGVFARDPDTILVMTRHECDDTFTVEPTLRNFKKIDAFCVERVHPLMQRNDQLNPTKLKQPGFKTKYTDEQLLEVLGTQSLGTMAWFTQAAHKLGIGKSTFMEKLKTMKLDKTKVVQGDDELWTAVTTEKEKGVGPEVQ